MSKVVVVIVTDTGEAGNDGTRAMQATLDQIQPYFKDHPDVKVFGTMRESADVILAALLTTTDFQPDDVSVPDGQARFLNEGSGLSTPPGSNDPA